MVRRSKHSLVIVALLVALISEQGLADTGFQPKGETSIKSSVEEFKQLQKKIKGSLGNSLSESKDSELDRLVHPLNQHETMAAAKPDDDPLSLFEHPHSPRINVENGENHGPEILRNLNSDKLAADQPKVQEWSTEHIDPVTGAHSKTTSRTFHHEQSSPTDDNHERQHETASESTLKSHKSFRRARSFSSTSSSSFSSFKGKQHSVASSSSDESSDDHSEPEKEEDEPETSNQDSDDELLLNLSRLPESSDDFAGEFEPLHQKNRKSATNRRHRHHANVPLRKEFKDSYIDRSDPANPQRVHVEVKSSVGPNGFSHERHETKKSIGGKSGSFKHRSSSHSSSFSSSSSSGGGGHRVKNGHRGFEANHVLVDQFPDHRQYKPRRHNHNHKRDKHQGEQFLRSMPYMPPMPRFPSLAPMVHLPTVTMVPVLNYSPAGAHTWSSSRVARSYSSAAARALEYHIPSSDFDPLNVGSSMSHRSRLSKRAKKHLSKKKTKRANHNHNHYDYGYDLYYR